MSAAQRTRLLTLRSRRAYPCIQPCPLSLVSSLLREFEPQDPGLKFECVLRGNRNGWDIQYKRTNDKVSRKQQRGQRSEPRSCGTADTLLTHPEPPPSQRASRKHSLVVRVCPHISALWVGPGQQQNAGTYRDHPAGYFQASNPWEREKKNPKPTTHQKIIQRSHI